ncbi:MAG: radical SAM protein [Desulfobacterales bacterium]|nr:MAG: radical SAM protein [Desulfobacterales bacterium]
MRLFLVNPPTIDGEKYIREGRCMQSVDSWAAIWPPLTLAILASIGKKYGEVRLIDCNVENLSSDETLQEIVAFKPDIVVVNATFPSIDSDAFFAKLVKDACAGAIVLGFGVFFTLLEETALRDTEGYDVAIIGEPEETFDEFLAEFQDKGKVSPMRGLMWREGKEIKKGDPRPFIEDLDTIPMASRDLIKNERYQLPHNGHPFTLVNVARGCPYLCTFCIANIYYGKKLRHHSIDYVLNEIETCMTQHGIKDFLFWEEIFTLDKAFGMGLCDEIMRRDLDISWATTTRADQVNEEILMKMKDAGCELLGLGIESCSQKILDNVQKHETVDQIKQAVALCKKVGMPTMGHFIFGLPGETEETAQETINFLASSGIDYMQCYCAVPYPKTPLGDMAKEKGWLVAERWSDYDFGGRSVMDIGAVSPDDVDRYRKTAFRKFYMRPKFILRQLKVITSIRQFLQAVRFTKWMKTKPKKTKAP